MITSKAFITLLLSNTLLVLGAQAQENPGNALATCAGNIIYMSTLTADKAVSNKMSDRGNQFGNAAEKFIGKETAKKFAVDRYQVLTTMAKNSGADRATETAIDMAKKCDSFGSRFGI
jgi:hypothetical protein